MATIGLARMKAIPPSELAEKRNADLIKSRLAGAKVSTVREWQQKWNEKHPDAKITVDGVVGRQTLSAMGTNVVKPRTTTPTTPVSSRSPAPSSSRATGANAIAGNPKNAPVPKKWKKPNLGKRHNPDSRSAADRIAGRV